MLRFSLSFLLAVGFLDEFLHFVIVVVICLCHLLLFFLPCEGDEVFWAIDSCFLYVGH